MLFLLLLVNFGSFFLASCGHLLRRSLRVLYSKRWCRLTIIAMSADVHKQTTLLQGLLHTVLPLGIAHVCHPVAVHCKDLISNLHLTERRWAAFSHKHNQTYNYLN